MPVEGATRAGGGTSGASFEGEAPQALPVEGATRAPIIAAGAKRKRSSPCSKLQGIHKLNLEIGVPNG